MDFAIIFIEILVVILLLIYYFIHRSLTYWERRNVPHIKPAFFYGNSKGIGKKFSSGEFFKDMYFKLKDKGPLVGVYVTVMPVALATDLDLIKTILVKDFDVFTNRGMYFNKEDDPVSAHLASIENEEWRSLRNKLSPTFTGGKIKMMLPIIDEVADTMIKSLSRECSQGDSVEMKEMSARFTIDVIAKVAFGIECNSLEEKDAEIYKMGLKNFDDHNFWKRSLTQTYPEFARKLHITNTKKDVVEFFRNIVQQTISYRRENNVQRNDFMLILMKMLEESTLTFDEVLAQCFIFFLAGYETSASTLSFCIYELSQFKDIQERARESVRKVLEKHDGKFTYEAVSEMQYIEQCIQETLRTHSPASATRRIARRDYKVPNTNITLEKGTAVLIPFNGIHFDPEIYPDPYTFNPDRFGPEEVAKRHNFSLLPFGEGPRICIGERFAMIEIKLALAKILMNYELELDRSKTPVPLEYNIKRILLTSKSGIFISIKKI